MMSKKYLFIAAVAVLAVGLFFGYIWGQGSGAVNAPAGLSPSVNCQLSDVNCARAASLMIDYGNGVVRIYSDLAVANRTTLLELTEKLAEKEKLEFKTKDYGDLGVLIEKIGDKKNGEEGKYWQYWVNNVSIQVGANAYIVKAGDVIEWKFLNYK